MLTRLGNYFAEKNKLSKYVNIICYCAQWSAKAESLRHKRQPLCELEGLLETVGLEVMVESIRAGTHGPEEENCRL